MAEKEKDFTTIVEPIEPIKETITAATQRTLEPAALPLFAQLPTKQPKKHYDPNTKVSNILSDMGATAKLERLWSGGQEPIEVFRTSYTDKKTGIKNTVSYCITAGFKMLDDSPLPSSYDYVVYHSICSFFAEKINRFTPAQIVRHMNGDDPDKKVTPDEISKVISSITKMRRALFTADVTQHFIDETVKYPDGTKETAPGKKRIYIDEPLLTVRGYQPEGYPDEIIYEIKAIPPLLQYALDAGQILYYPVNILALREAKGSAKRGAKIKSTEKVLIYKQYLADRIERMKLNPKMSRNILYDTIWSNTGTQSDDKTAIARQKRTIRNILESWKISGYIKGFAEFEEKGRGGTRPIGVTIELPPAPKGNQQQNLFGEMP